MSGRWAYKRRGHPILMNYHRNLRDHCTNETYWECYLRDEVEELRWEEPGTCWKPRHSNLGRSEGPICTAGLGFFYFGRNSPNQRRYIPWEEDYCYPYGCNKYGRRTYNGPYKDPD